MKLIFILILCVCVYGNPLMIQDSKPSMEDNEMNLMEEEHNTIPATLDLPSNATAIRAEISDNFTCEGKSYGYYADVQNECQIFHVCLPVEFPDGNARNFRWSFICPEETVFSQDKFTCVRSEDLSIECKDSEMYYQLNKNFGEESMSQSEEGSNEMQMIDKSDEKSNDEIEKFVHFDLNYHNQLKPEQEKLPQSHQPFTMEMKQNQIKQNQFPSYLVHEMIDDKKPNIFLPLKINLEQEILNFESNKHKDNNKMPERLEMKIPTGMEQMTNVPPMGILSHMPIMNNEMDDNNNEMIINESMMDGRNVERRHVKRRKTQPKRRLLFKADKRSN